MGFKKIIAMLTAVCFTVGLLSGCSGTASDSPSASTSTQQPTAAQPSTSTQQTTGTQPDAPFDPMAKYDPPITIDVVEALYAERSYMPGENYMDNIWTKAYEEEMGIKFNYLWTADSAQYQERLNIAMVSDDMPDILVADYAVFYKLATNGKLADITNVYDQYVSPLTREYAARGDSYGLKNCTLDGKLYGITGSPSVLPQDLLYIRDDWMKALNLDPPKNMDDVIAIARAFATQDPDGNDKDDTYGIGIDKEISSGGMDMRGFFNGYYTYPQQWVVVNGKLEWGSIQPEIKEVLAILQTMYAEGLMNKEFPQLDTWERSPDDISSGKVGLLYGQNWIPYWAPLVTLITDNPEATWSHYQIPTVDGKPGHSWTDASIGKVIFAFNDFEHPEALIKIINFINEKLRDPDKAIGDFHTKDGVENFFFSKFLDGTPGPSYQSQTAAAAVVTALESGDTSALNPEQQGYYDQCKAWLDNQDPAGWGGYAIFGPGGTMMKQIEMVDNKHYHVNGYTGPKTETMTDKSEAIRQKEIEIFTQIIMGAPLSTFDEYVSYFHAQGGDVMTQEVNEWYEKQVK